MSPDDLIAAFTELAAIDPDMRIDRAKVDDVDAIHLAGWRNVQTKHKFEALASDAAALFAPIADDGDDDETHGEVDEIQRWLWIVRKQAPELVEAEPVRSCYTEDGKRVELVAETIPHAASASVLAVRRLRDAVERLRTRGNPDAVPTGPTPERDDSALVMAMMSGGSGRVIRDAQGREVAAGQLADRLAELNARLAAKSAERGDGWADVPDDARLSSREIADKAGVVHEPLRKRLDRWRRKNPDQSGGDWFEVSDRKSKDPQFLYRVGAVRAIVGASGKRPAK